MTTWQDVRYALRLLVKSPGFALTSVLTLALAIGANAAIFSAVKGVLVAPLPYPEPDRLVRLFEESATTPHFPMAPADFRDYRAELRTFEGLAAYMRNDLQIAEDGRPEQLRGMQVTAGFFTLLGYRPAARPRVRPRRRDARAATDVVVLSHALWMRRFNGDPAIVGQVRPALGPDVSGRRRAAARASSTWAAPTGRTGTVRPSMSGRSSPCRATRTAGSSFSHYFNVVGRDSPGASSRGAMAGGPARRRGGASRSAIPSPNSPWSPRAVPLKQEIVGAAESTLVALSVRRRSCCCSRA